MLGFAAIAEVALAEIPGQFTTGNGGKYFLLVPHFIKGTWLDAWETVTDGVEVPPNWIPTLGVDPKNAAAVQAFYNAGPRPSTEGKGELYGYQGWQFPSRFPIPGAQSAIQPPATYWIRLANGLWKLTGLGSSFPPIGV